MVKYRVSGVKKDYDTLVKARASAYRVLNQNESWNAWNGEVEVYDEFGQIGKAIYCPTRKDSILWVEYGEYATKRYLHKDGTLGNVY